MSKINTVSFAGKVNINKADFKKNMMTMRDTSHAGMLENYLQHIGKMKSELLKSTPEGNNYSIRIKSNGKPKYSSMDKIFIDVIDESAKKAYILEMGRNNSKALAKLYTIQAGEHYIKPEVFVYEDISDTNEFRKFLDKNFNKFMCILTGKKPEVYHITNKTKSV